MSSIFASDPKSELRESVRDTWIGYVLLCLGSTQYTVNSKTVTNNSYTFIYIYLFRYISTVNNAVMIF